MLQKQSSLKQFDTYKMQFPLHLWNATPAEGSLALSAALRQACFKVK
jgi:hypothetical protein